MVCHLIYDGNHLQQVLDKATGKLCCKIAKIAENTLPQPWPARIQVPKKGTFTCNSSTAEEAVEYLRQVSPGRLRLVKQSIHGTLCKDGSSKVSSDPCVEFVAKKKSVFLVESLKPRRTLGSSFQHPGWMSPGTATCCYPAVHRSWNPSSSCRNSMPILYLGAEGDMGRSPGHFGMATMLWQRCYPKRKQKQVAICGESDSGNHVAMAFRCLRTIRG